MSVRRPSMDAPAQARARAVLINEPADNITRFGLYALCAYIFFAYGRISELIAVKTGVPPPIMSVLMVVAIFVSVIAGGILRFVSNKGLICIAAYYAWSIACVPLSIWKGASLDLVLYELKMGLIFVGITSLIRRTQQIRQILLAIAASMIVLVLAGQSMTEGDYRLSFEAGSLANPNQLANHLLIGLPLCWVIGIDSKRFSWQNIVRYTVLATSAYMLIRTGSRGGIVTAAVLAIVIFLSLSLINKVKFALIFTVGILLAVTVAPRAAIDRYRTMVSKDAESPGEALGSTASREELLRASINITLRHPIFGVGPAAFVMAYNQDLFLSGKRHHWEATHNAYTQISSETGIPALLFYLGAFFFPVRRLLSMRKIARHVPQLNPLYRTISVLLLAIVAYLTTGFFTSNAHEFYFPLLVGLAITLEYCGDEEMRAALSRAGSGAAAQPVPGARPLQPPVRPVRPRLPAAVSSRLRNRNA